MRSAAGKRALFWGMFVLFILIDQAVKAWVRGAFPEGGSYHGLPFPGVFELTLTYNKGIAFGMLGGFGPALAPIAIVISIVAAVYVYRHPEETRWNHCAFGLLAAGAIGNLIDRVLMGRVTDMLYFRLINFPVFNIADSCITVATIMLIISWWMEAGREKKTDESSEELPEPETEGV